jgi:prophage regulatory protein
MNPHENETQNIRPQTILRLPTVIKETGLSRSTIYLNIGNGLLTHPVKIGKRAVGWPRYEILEINSARISGNNDEEIKLLVIKLEAARKTPRA